MKKIIICNENLDNSYYINSFEWNNNGFQYQSGIAKVVQKRGKFAIQDHNNEIIDICNSLEECFEVLDVDNVDIIDYQPETLEDFASSKYCDKDGEVLRHITYLEAKREFEENYRDELNETINQISIYLKEFKNDIMPNIKLPKSFKWNFTNMLLMVVNDKELYRISSNLNDMRMQLSNHKELKELIKIRFNAELFRNALSKYDRSNFYKETLFGDM